MCITSSITEMIFLILGPPDSTECCQAMDITSQVCKELGVPIAEDKLEGPVTQLTFLGIEINSINMFLKLPEDKRAALKSLLDTWSRTKCIQDMHQLQSLLGCLVHACHVLPLRKAFLNNLFPLSNTMQPKQTWHLNCAARCDLALWSIMCSHWSGISVHQFLLLQEPKHLLFTDASKSWGCGAWTSPHWLQWQWTESSALHMHSIMLKELFPITLACAVWGLEWSRSYVVCHSDNSAAVSQVNHLHARDPLAVVLK